jgi:hypothetical protein
MLNKTISLKTETLKANELYLKALVIVVLMVASTFTMLALIQLATTTTSTVNINDSTNSKGPNQLVKLPISATGVVSAENEISQAVNPNDVASIMVSLQYQHQAQLNSFLDDVQNPLSSQYHQFLSKADFASTYSPKVSDYNGLTDFFSQQGLQVNKFDDRVSINLVGTFKQFEDVFHTQINVFRSGSESYFAPTKQLSVESSFANAISGISGLNNKWHAQLQPMFTGSGSSEKLYGTDLQVGYQLDQLYSAGYPTSMTIVTILWAGTDSSGNKVGAYYPNDITNYFSQVIPAGQPQPQVYGYPVGGAAAPGLSSTKDTSQANYESTLDIEMAGSLAPGASIVEVYGPQATMNYLDQCFAAVLNPSGSSGAATALQNTVVISNSWGGSDSTDSLWHQYEQQAAARGITVLASSGDDGTTTTPSFPATSAYNTYGTIAVGGTTTILSGTASNDGTGTTGISSQSVWYNTPSAGDGSQSGVSSVYAKPNWQAGSSDANSVISAVRNGRGTADIAGVGANTLIYITSSSGSAGMVTLFGTSVASPLVAGQVAVMDNYMGSLEGFFAPTIYQLGQAQYDGQYASAKPFYDVTTGATAHYSALAGYDLPTGWGSINSYNFVLAQTGGGPTTHTVTFTESGLPASTSWSVTFNGNTKSSTTSTISFTIADGSYSYTVGSVSGYISSPNSGSLTVSGADVNRAITFTAAPTYTVSFTESGLSSGTSWSVTLSGVTHSSTTSTVSFTESAGTYSYSVGAVNGYSASPSSGSVSVTSSNVNQAITFSVVTQQSGIYAQVSANSISTYSLNEAEQFNVGTSTVMVNYVTVYLAGSGSATVSIGSALWGSDKLAPQTVNIVSGQNYYNISFAPVTLTASTNYYLNVQTASGSPTWGYTTSATTNLHATQDYWYSGSSLRNDNSYPNIFTVGYQAAAAPTHSVTFTESGLTSGTSWSVTLAGSTLSSTTNTITFSKVDGSYSYTVNTVSGYTVSPSSGTVTVSGSNVNKAISFTALPTYTISFTESGLPSGTSWSVTLAGSTKSSTTSTVSFTEPAGTYSYSIGSVSGYTASPTSGSVTVTSSAVNTAVTFTQNTYTMSFTESGLPSGTSWSVTAGGSTKSSTTSTISFTEPAGTYSYTVGSVTGYTSAPSSGSVTITTANKNTAITFTSTSTPSVTAYSYVKDTSFSYYSLPEAEQFNVGSTSHSVNFISVLLSGSGSVTVSIGSTLWGTDKVPAQTINVIGGQTNYTVSFTSVALSASTSYYLNVQLVSGSVQWGYTSSPTAKVGATRDYWYSGSTLYNDNSYPNAYSVGYNTAGPAIVSNTATTSNSQSNMVNIITKQTKVTIKTKLF